MPGCGNCRTIYAMEKKPQSSGSILPITSLDIWRQSIHQRIPGTIYGGTSAILVVLLDWFSHRAGNHEGGPASGYPHLSLTGQSETIKSQVKIEQRERCAMSYLHWLKQ